MTTVTSYATAQDGTTPATFTGQLTNPANAVGSSEASTSATVDSTQNVDFGTLFSFDFSTIPDGSTINSVTLEARQWLASNAARGQEGWRLESTAGTAVGSELLDTCTQTTAPTAGTIGAGSTYTTWGTLPTTAQLKAASFRVRCRWRRTAAQAVTYNLDWVRVTVDYTEPTVNTDVRVSFPTPTASPDISGATQEFRALVRKKGALAANPTAAIELWENGTLKSTVVSATSITNTTGQVISGFWDASTLTTASGANVEAKVVGAGAPGVSVEVGAIRWNKYPQDVAAAPSLLFQPNATRRMLMRR